MRSFDRSRNSRSYRWVMAAGVMLILVAFTLLGLSFSGLVGGDTASTPAPAAAPAAAAPAPSAAGSDASTSTGFNLGPDGERFSGLAEGQPAPGAAAEVPPDAAPPPAVRPARLVIAKIQVEAPVVTLGLDADGVMESPAGPFEVGWYGFTAVPGSDGNAVFSGHVDYIDVGPAVFWDLHKLGTGDLVQVRLADGTAYSYVVASSVSYPADDAPIEEIVGPTGRDTITLITCSGTFNRDVRQYSERLVVRAVRL